MHNCYKWSITVTRSSLFCLSGFRLSVQIPSWTYCFNLLTSVMFYSYLIITQSHNKLVRCSKSTKPKFLSRCMWLTGQCDGNDGVLPSGHSQNSTAGWVDGNSFIADFCCWWVNSCLLYYSYIIIILLYIIDFTLWLSASLCLCFSGREPKVQIHSCHSGRDCKRGGRVSCPHFCRGTKC